MASVVAVGLFRSAGYFDYLVRLNRQKVRVRVADTEMLRRSVPRALASLVTAMSEPQVWSTLEEMVSAAGLANAEVRDEGGASVHTWSAQPTVKRDELVSAHFPVGPDRTARTSIVFRWQAAEREVNPQTEILLQVAVDALGRRLVALAIGLR